MRDRDAARLAPAHAAVAREEADGARRARPAALEDAADALAHRLAIVGMHVVEHRAADNLVGRRVAEEGHERRIHVDHLEVGEVREETVGEPLDQRLVVGEQSIVRLGGAYLLGHIARHGEAHAASADGQALDDALRDELPPVLAPMGRGEHEERVEQAQPLIERGQGLGRPDVAQGHAQELFARPAVLPHRAVADGEEAQRVFVDQRHRQRVVLEHRAVPARADDGARRRLAGLERARDQARVLVGQRERVVGAGGEDGGQSLGRALVGDGDEHRLGALRRVGERAAARRGVGQRPVDDDEPAVLAPRRFASGRRIAHAGAAKPVRRERALDRTLHLRPPQDQRQHRRDKVAHFRAPHSRRRPRLSRARRAGARDDAPATDRARRTAPARWRSARGRTARPAPARAARGARALRRRRAS